MQQVSAYRIAFPLAFPCVFWKFEVGERFGLKKRRWGNGVPPYFNHCIRTQLNRREQKCAEKPPKMVCTFPRAGVTGVPVLQFRGSKVTVQLKIA